MKKYLPLTIFIVGLFAIQYTFLYAAPIAGAGAGGSVNELSMFIVRFSLFLRNILLPFIISIAFLFFLINMMKYFIIEGDSDDGRTKAKRSAFYGIGAFVFLFTLWGLTNLLISGIGIEQDESMCPDYLQGFCKNTNHGSITGGAFPPPSPGTGTYTGTFGTGGSTGSGSGGSTGGGYTGGGSGGSGGNSGGGSTGSSGGSSGGSGGSSGGGSTNTSGLAELVFGTGKDSAQVVTHPGAPRAAINVVTVAENTSCEDGFETLTRASRSENAQAAYVLYKNTDGATRWKNITDVTNMNHISFDEDLLESIINSGATDMRIVHTHPRKRTEQLELTMEGHGPTAADMRAMCTINKPTIPHLVVDWGGIWTILQKSDTCPYIQPALTTLPLIETYAAIATIESTQRLGETRQYVNSSIPPQTYKDHFAGQNKSIYADLTPEQMLEQSSGYQSYASTTVLYQVPPAEFCNEY